MAVCAAAILIGWSLYSLGLQTRSAMRPPPGAWSPVFAWRANTPLVGEVRGFAERVGARVPEGEPILFTLGEGGDDEFFLAMWTAYHLPHHPVLRRQNVAPGTAAPDYRLDFGAWPPDEPMSPGPPSAVPRRARLLLEGLGTLWYVPRLGAESEER